MEKGGTPPALVYVAEASPWVPMKARETKPDLHVYLCVWLCLCVVLRACVRACVRACEAISHTPVDNAWSLSRYRPRAEAVLSCVGGRELSEEFSAAPTTSGESVKDATPSHLPAPLAQHGVTQDVFPWVQRVLSTIGTLGSHPQRRHGHAQCQKCD